MAEEKNKKVKEPKNEKINKTKDNVTKVEAKKPKDNIIKVDLSKPPVENEEVKEQLTEEQVVIVNEEPKAKEEVVKEDKKETPVVEEVLDKEDEVKIESNVSEEIEVKQDKTELPENIEKLIDFMKETGGDINDYVELNRDVSKMDDSEVLDEYYRKTKSHLSPEERNFILEEKFSYDEDSDDPRDIKKKKIALKEQVAEAKAHLDRQKSIYYEEIKAGSRLTPEAKKAMDFFNRYNKESEEQKLKSDASKKVFKQKTDSLFNDNFKGFDYQVGDKKFRFNVKNKGEIKETQSDLNNFINKYVGEDNMTIKDAEGYHKSLFTAMNADNIAKHFYEQGKADAIKETIAKDKNINIDPRQTHGETEVGGMKFKVLGESTSDIKNRSFKIKKRN